MSTIPSHGSCSWHWPNPTLYSITNIYIPSLKVLYVDVLIWDCPTNFPFPCKKLTQKPTWSKTTKQEFFHHQLCLPLFLCFSVELHLELGYVWIMFDEFNDAIVCQFQRVLVNSSQTHESNWVVWDLLSKQTGQVQCRFHHAVLRNSSSEHGAVRPTE